MIAGPAVTAQIERLAAQLTAAFDAHPEAVIYRALRRPIRSGRPPCQFMAILLGRVSERRKVLLNWENTGV